MTAPEAFPAADREFREFLSQGRFMLQRSRSSGRHVFPPRVAEPGTGARDLEWVAASGRGTLHAITLLPRKAPEPAHCIVLVDLAEGPRVLSTLRDEAPETAAIGEALQADIEQRSEGPLLVFRRASAKRHAP